MNFGIFIGCFPSDFAANVAVKGLRLFVVVVVVVFIFYFFIINFFFSLDFLFVWYLHSGFCWPSNSCVAH